MEGRVRRFWSFLTKNWNIIVAVISSMGFIISSLLPNKGTWAEAFAFSGLVAILFTLIEIKMQLSTPPKATMYKSMREARPEIMKVAKDTIKGNHRHTVEIHMLGGLIRTISDMLREIVNDIRRGDLHARNIKLIVYCLSPDFLVSWDCPGIVDKQTFKTKNQGQGQMIMNFTRELLSYNDLEQFKKDNISIEIVYYKCFPSIYGFLIGEESLFWGNFTWNFETDDFQGPENACYYINSKSDYFENYYNTFLNRTKFLRMSSEICYHA